MAYASAESGGYGDASVIQFDPAHAEHIKVPDAELLFRGEYQRCDAVAGYTLTFGACPTTGVK